MQTHFTANALELFLGQLKSLTQKKSTQSTQIYNSFSK